MENGHKNFQGAERVGVVQPGETSLQLFVKEAYTRDGEMFFYQTL